ncbi:hypothetical protein SDC9_101498 [bioreactor metagenome]|uniref:ChsH2 C-terminal OB-fold domain-containing protein n=1 Tax=bioreactor metagenome TaxID=1076179 RepID=A0A645APM6_9ZZZZ
METLKIYTYTIIRSPAPAFQSCAPYICAVLERGDGSRFMCKIDGYKDGLSVTVGQPVKEQVTDGQTIYYV